MEPDYTNDGDKKKIDRYKNDHDIEPIVLSAWSSGVCPNSVSVWVDGDLLMEGRDYYVDYENGMLYMYANRPIDYITYGTV